MGLRVAPVAALGWILLVGCGDGDPMQWEPEPTIEYWNDWEPKWSPDGSQIAVRSNRATRHVPDEDPQSVLYSLFHYDIFLLDALGNAVQVTDGLGDLPPWSTEGMDVRSLSWSPDGRLAFTSGKSLWVVNRDGTGLNELLTYDEALALSNAAWSPTDSAIAFSWTPWCTNSGCAPGRISVFDLETSSVTLLTDPDEISTFALSWSPDGSHLAYWARTAEGVRMEQMSRDGSDRVVLFEGGGQDFDLAWSPCGDQIAFSRTTAPRTHWLMVVDVDGSGLRQVTRGEQPSWSPDCAELAYIRPYTDDSGIDVWVVNADGTGERRITRRD